MKHSLRRTIDIPHAVIGLAVWLTSLVVYTLTKAPTLSFWDCGEFIAASAILGVPHPPGSPLYILFGRIFSILPLSSDIAVRVNFLSCLTSSFTALFGYLTAARVLRLWFGTDRSPLTRGLIYAGSAAGAFFVAFGFTNWNNSVEAEVYGMTMMMMSAILWLTLIYAEKRGTLTGERIMLLIVFLGFLGIGVHMSTFLVIAVAALFFIIKREASSQVWYAAAVFFVVEFYLLFALSSQPGEIPYYVPVLIVFLFYLFYIFSFERIPGRCLLIGAGFMVAIAPLYAVLLQSIGKTTVPDTGAGGAGAALNIVGKVAFAALILYAVYSLLVHFTRKGAGRRSSSYLITSVFILTAAIFTAILSLPKGYEVFLVLTGLAAIILFVIWRRDFHWPLVLAIGGASLVILGVKQMFYGLVISAVAIVLLGVMFKFPRWRSALMVLLCAVAGYSVHLFLPIRSAQHPMINENNPSASLAATINFLERKQYGSQSMVERMFKRRAEWENQFGNHQRMGFWGFFHQQYGITGPKFVALFLLGVFGVWEVIRRRFETGLPFLILLLVSSVGLILYMNFADGTRQNPVSGLDYLEVRNRDYFFTPAFVFFGLAIGIGIAIVVQYVRQSVAGFSALPGKLIVTSSLVLFLLPTFALARNYYYCDRSRVYTPYDYAWNLLDSADPNAVLFTYGDNDTFPPWCLQEAYGVRKDVKVVNLSLANTHWYIKQIKHNMHLELGWTDEHIDQLRPFRTPDGTTFQLRDQVIDAIITHHRDTLPINFSVTVSAGARRYKGKPIDTLLELSGMVWRVDTAGPPLRVDIKSTVDFYTDPNRFRARGVNDPSIYKDETTLRLTRNWANGFLVAADYLRRAGDMAGAERLAAVAVEKIPYASDAVEFLANIYADQLRAEDLRALIERSEDRDRPSLSTLLAQVERKQGHDDVAEQILNNVLRTDPSYRPALQELIRVYYENRQFTRMQTLLQRWLQFNPRDEQVSQLLNELHRAAANAADQKDS